VDPREVFGKRAAMYARSASHADPQVLAEVVRMASPRKEWRALDVATGTGHTALALAPLVRAVVGTDVTKEMLAEAARLRASKGAANYALVLGDAHRLPVASLSFDLVTCRRAAHHFRDVKVALAEMMRALKPGGRLVIDDRSVPDNASADRVMNQLDRLHDPSHVREHRAGEWRAMLQACGFEVEETKRYVRHRPMSALTDGVPPADAQRIREILESLDDEMRELFDLRDLDGELHHNHWFVMLAATKP
jgi:ubiquinone/menaquinone biosynthesis C-methylase UbiE